MVSEISEKPHPSILIGALPAPDPKALATQAIEEEWTAKQVREEVAKQKEVVTGSHYPVS